MKQFRRPILYLLSIHVAALALLTLFRLIFYISVRPLLTADAGGDVGLTLTAFLRGLWFDNVVACYIMALPLVVTSVAAIAGRWHRRMWRMLNVWFGVLYVPVFMAAAGNIPYFVYFSKPLNASIWNWAGYGGTTLGMIFGEASYYLYVAAFFVAVGAFSCFLFRLRRRMLRTEPASPAAPRPWKAVAAVAGISAALLGLCFLGIRGRLGYNPIKVSAAYFCTSPVLNNLGVNPAFALLQSTLDDMRPENARLHLMSDADAVKQVQSLYGRSGIEGISPIAREVKADGAPTRRNVVIVLMESMSAKLMSRFGNGRRLTPTLDSLYRHSLSFSNFYSAGTHTNHGIYATLCAFPSVMFRNAMKGTDVPRYSCLPTVLKDNGYSTMFFMTHESQYDNMNAFLRTNGFDEVYAQEDYPRSEVVNHFGVPDDYLFRYALPVLRSHAAAGRPFFATLLTVSNHPPYVVPEQYADKSLKPEEQIVRYADDCIRRFMEAVGKEPWAANTIFVFLGDHGKLLGQADIELPESFNHIPLIIHGAGITPQERDQFACQVDAAPTLLGLLGISYVQNNFGLDLLRDAPRPAAFYTADKTIAARNEKHLYVYNAELDREYFYNLRDGRTTPCGESPEFAPLRSYVFSLLQTTEYMVGKGMTTTSRRSRDAK